METHAEIISNQTKFHAWISKCVLIKHRLQETKSKHWAVCVKEGGQRVHLVPCSFKCDLAWLFEIERRRGESFLCLPSPKFLAFPSPSKPMFWFWPWSSRTASFSLRLPLRLAPDPRFSVGSWLCLSTGHSWFPFTQAQSTLYLLEMLQKEENKKKVKSKGEMILLYYLGSAC